MLFSPENGGLGDDLPLTIDFTTGFYTHREGPGIVFGGREPEIEDVAVHALHRLPVIAELPIQSQWWGYYENSPDHNAIVGATEPRRALHRHRLLRPRLPAVPGRRRAPRRADRRPPVSIPMEPFGLDRSAAASSASRRSSSSGGSVVAGAARPIVRHAAAVRALHDHDSGARGAAAQRRTRGLRAMRDVRGPIRGRPGVPAIADDRRRPTDTTCTGADELPVAPRFAEL